MKHFFLNIFSILLIILIILSPSLASEYSRQALSLCYEVIIPSLFPFFVCSGILVYSGFAQTAAVLLRPIMKPLFNVNENGAAAFVLGILSGYPLGAVTACRLYENAYLSKTETERLLSFCNNSGPLFIFGAIASSIYMNAKIGTVIYLSHILSALTVGIIFRFYGKNGYAAPVSKLEIFEKSDAEIFSTALSNSLSSILTVCGSIIFFFTASNILMGLLPENTALKVTLSALLEMTDGIKKISVLDIPLNFRIVLTAAAVGFSGLCVHIQVLSVTHRYGLSMKPYILGKTMQALFSIVYSSVILKLCEIPTLHKNAAPFSFSCAVSCGFIILISALCLIFGMILKKNKIPEKP